MKVNASNRWSGCAPAVLVGCLISGIASADTLRVPGDFPTIQGALSAAAPGDVVLVADGVYTGPGNVDLDFGGKAITLQSENGPAACIIDCNATQQNPHRGIAFVNGETSETVVDGFTIRNGATPQGAILDEFNGAGILVANASNPTIRNMVITGAWAGCWGGAICCSSQSSPLIENCLITGNYSDDDGGGIFAWDFSAPVIVNTVIAGNGSRVVGGGICSFTSGMQIINCTVVDNTTSFGAGIYGWGTTISNSIVWGNHGDQQIQGNPVSITYTNVEGGFAGQGNLNVDPMFVDALGGDFRLAEGSPLIDAGRNDAPAQYVSYDASGGRRFIDDPFTIDTGLGNAPVVDIGAFEHQPAAVEALPHDFTVGLGAWQSGTAEDLHVSDDAYLVAAQRPSLSVLLPLIRMDVHGTSASASALDLAVTLEAASTAMPSLPPQRLSLRNQQNGTWEMVDQRTATRNDSVVEVTIEGDAQRFVDVATRAAALRIEYFDPGNVFSPHWGARVDQAVWLITP